MLETMLNGNPVEVSGLDAEWLLDLAAEAEVRERQAGRAKLRVAARWCVLHPATEETGFVTWSDKGLPGLRRDRGGPRWGGNTVGGGVHARTVRRRARGVHPVRAAVVGRRPGPAPTGSPGSGPPSKRWRWRRGRPARSPRPPTACPRPAPRLWTRQLADRIGSCGWRAIEMAVAQAIATYDPHLLETRDRQGQDAWNVRLIHRGSHRRRQSGRAPATSTSLATPSTSPAFTTSSASRPATKALGDTDTLDPQAKAVSVMPTANPPSTSAPSSDPTTSQPAEPFEPCRLRPKPSSTSTCR